MLACGVIAFSPWHIDALTLSTAISVQSQLSSTPHYLAVQVQAQHTHPTIATALRRLLATAHDLLQRGRKHPLQATRASAAWLVPMHLAVLRSATPMLGCTAPSDATGASAGGGASSEDLTSGGHSADGGEAACTERAITKLLDDAIAAAYDALSDANAASSAKGDAASDATVNGAPAPAAPSNGAEGVSSPRGAQVSPQVRAWEATFGFAAAAVYALNGSMMLEPLLLDIAVPKLGWIIEAQGLENPDLQSTIKLLRQTWVGLKAPLLGRAEVPAVVDVAGRCIDSRAWQARGTAVGLLQVTWFRCEAAQLLHRCML